MPFVLKSVPNKEVILASLDKESFEYLRAIPEDKVKEEADITARVGNFVHLKSILQQVGVPPHLANLDFQEFDKDNDAFSAWLQEHKVIMPYTLEYHPSTGKPMFRTRMLHNEAVIDFYAKKLSDLFVKQMYFQHTFKLLVNYHKEVVFVDRWLVAQDYETFEAVEEAIKKHVDAVNATNDLSVKVSEKIAEKASESVL